MTGSLGFTPICLLFAADLSWSESPSKLASLKLADLDLGIAIKVLSSRLIFSQVPFSFNNLKGLFLHLPSLPTSRRLNDLAGTNKGRGRGTYPKGSSWACGRENGPGPTSPRRKPCRVRGTETQQMYFSVFFVLRISKEHSIHGWSSLLHVIKNVCNLN